ncbi:unnamed protein product [Adineta ricciae]|uniref:Uncharacterized protein n=1 Tax=Adineta ricciae TaxID=249248 RepID=A0A814FUZ6_ADIRI|nr:unnamed protein product [Adineta ricciae]
MLLTWINIYYKCQLTVNQSTSSSWEHNSSQTEKLGSTLTYSTDRKMKPMYIFVHAPKTGGTIIRVILNHWCLATNKICRELIIADQYGDIRELRAMNASELNQIDVLIGHIPYGVHHMMKLKRPVKYITIIRDPVQQTISAFHFRRYSAHHLAGAFALQSVIHQLNNTLQCGTTSLDCTYDKFQLNHNRNAVISYLTRNQTSFPNAKGCFAGLGGTEGWSQVHNFSVERLQSLNTSFLLKFANAVVNQAWKSDCRGSLDQILGESFQQFLKASIDSQLIQKDYGSRWTFGNNPVTTLFCCYHFWENTISEKDQREQRARCPHIRNDKTKNCALDNMNQIDLILIKEQTKLSLQLLEVFLNWTIPAELKRLRINEAVYVTPKPPPIKFEDLVFAEKLTKLDRIIYQTAVLKFWTNVHSRELL